MELGLITAATLPRIPTVRHSLYEEKLGKFCAFFWYIYKTASVFYWLEFLAANTEFSGSIPGATRFSE
jgi:hypothetical protein